MFTDHPVQTHARRLLLSGQAVSRRHRTAARWIVAACLAFIAVAAMFLVAPEWLTAGRPPLIALVFAVSLGLMVDLYLEGRANDRELRSARVALLDARDNERLRIQRDLHDSAQQRLVSVRVHLGLLADASDRSADRASIDQLGQELDTALAEIGAVTRNEYPQMLRLQGLAPSLRSATRRSPIPVSVDADGFGRYSEPIERNVYFCCLEALQNVVKHGGSSAKARIRLLRDAHERRLRSRGFRGRFRPGAHQARRWAGQPGRPGGVDARAFQHRLPTGHGHAHPWRDPGASHEKVPLPPARRDAPVAWGQTSASGVPGLMPRL